MQQELDSEVPEEEVKAEAQVDLSELKELPILDIADAVPPEAMMKPTSGQVLPSEATRGSSILDSLETPMAELIEGGKHVRLEDHGKVHEGQSQLMDDGSTLEKAQTHISEREATQGGSESPSAADATLGSRDQTTVSKQATQASMTGGQKSFLGQVFIAELHIPQKIKNQKSKITTALSENKNKSTCVCVFHRCAPVMKSPCTHSV